jgi:hypothetical protein
MGVVVFHPFVGALPEYTAELPESKPDEDISVMDANALRTEIIRPALKLVDLHSAEAEDLLLGTALVESGLKVVTQFKGGPALSFFQIEPATYVDCVSYLTRINRNLGERILSSIYAAVFPEAQALAWNMRLAVLIARTKYFMVPEALPKTTDVAGMAAYWKKHYNTAGGKGSVDKYVQTWLAYQRLERMRK